jgi:photosystem II stability/assembly factor-like uncharacterized protein
MRKTILLLAIGCLLVVMAETSAPTPTIPQNQQITTTQTATNPVPVTQNQASALALARLGEVFFLDQNTGYLTATLTEAENEQAKNELWKTGDGGHTWTHVYSGQELSSPQFPSGDVGYAIETETHNGGSISTMLVETQDGGVSWRLVTFFALNKLNYPYGVNCVDQDVVFVAAEPGASQDPFPVQHIFRTIDGGRSWAQILLPQDAFGTVTMSWLSASDGYALATLQPGAGNQPKTLYLTVNGGRSWAVRSTTGKLGDQMAANSGLPMGGYAAGLSFYPDGVGYLGEGRGFVYKTTDGGKTFKAISSYSDSNTVPDFLDQKTGHLISGDSLLYTTDGGAAWTQLWPSKTNG